MAWDNQQSGNYKQAGGFDEYQIETGLIAVPVAEEPPTDPTALASWSPVRFIRVHPPYRRRFVHFKASKNGTPPQLPPPESSGACVLMSGMVAYQTPQIDSTLGNYTWTGTVQHEYIENCRHSHSDGYLLTNLPWTTPTQADMQMSIGQGFTPPFGAIAQAGADARTGYTAALQLSPSHLTQTNFTYTIPSYLPPLFFNDQMINGYTG